MSWAAHNPEAWEKLERDAAGRWLTNLYVEVNNQSPDEDTIAGIADALQGEQPDVFCAIMDAGAEKEVDESERFESFVL